MAEKKRWRDYSKSETAKAEEGVKRTGTWRDYAKDNTSDQSSGGWRSYSKLNSSSIVGDNVVTRVNAWLNKHNSYLSEYQKRYDGRKYSYEDAYVGDSAEWLASVGKKKSEFDAEADSIISYIDQNKGYLNQDWIDDIKYAIANARSTQNQLLISSRRDNEYWNRFKPNEEQTAAGYTAEKLYAEWQAGQKQGVDDLAFDVEAGMVDLEKLKQERDAYLAGKLDNDSFWTNMGRFMGNTGATSLGTSQISEYDRLIAEKEAQIERAKYAQGYQKYMANMNADDYAANSQYVSTRTEVPMEDAIYYVSYGSPGIMPGAEGGYVEQPFDPMYDKEKLFGNFLHDYINRNKDAIDVSLVNDTSDRSYFMGHDKGFLQTMTDEEIGVYNYLYNKNPEEAKAYLSFIESDLEGRRRIQEQAEWAAYAKESPVASSVFSTLISPMKGFSYLGQAADMLDDGKLDKDAGYNRFSYIPSTIRSQVSSIIERGNWGKVGSFAYNTGMSMADFLFTTAVSGGNQALSLAIMGTGAAADATLAAKDRGLDDGQAFTLGTIAGLAEVAMEKISLSAWLEGDMTEGALRYVLKNALSEGVEEAGTSVTNLLADIIIAGDKSEWKMAMQEYISQGKSEEEAFALVLAENAAQIGLDTLGGIISGSAIGGGTYAGASISAGFNYGKTGKDKTYTQKLVAEGIELNPDSKYVQKAKSKVDKGKNLTGMQVRNILAANQSEITKSDMKKIQQAAEKRLTALGQTEDVQKVAELATKYATGGKLTREETSFLANSQYGSRVANELLPENIASGDYSTEWAENIGTKQVNFGAYNIRAIVDEMLGKGQYKSLESRMEGETPAKVSDTGKAVIADTKEEVDLTKPVFKQITDDGVVLEVDGKAVSTDEIEYDSMDQGLAINAIGKIEHITPSAASALYDMVDMTKDVMPQLNGIDEAFTYGYYNYPETDLEAGLFTGNLTKDQLNDVYKLGQYVAKNTDTAKADAFKAMRTAADAKLTAEQKKARQKARIESDDVEVYFEDGKTITKFDEHSGKYDEKRMAAVNYAKFLSKMGIGGSGYYFYKSYVNADGVRVYKNADGIEEEAPNGMFKASDGSIHIDLNAGDMGQGTALFTLGHELTHFIREWSEAKFKVLADFLIEEYGKTNVSMRERVLEKQKFLENKRGGEKVSYDEAFEEVVADAMSTMLSDGNLHEKLAKLKSKDGGLFDKIKEFFDKLIAKFQALYKDLTPEQQAARDVRAMKDAFDNIQQAFAEALVEASENFHASELVLAESGISVNPRTESGSLLSVRDVLNENDRKKVAKALAERFNVTIKEATEWLKAETSLASIILNPKYSAFLDYEADPNEVAIKQNSDYPQGTVDFSNICKKRREFTQVMNRILRNFPNHVFAATDLAKIRTIMGEEGMTLPCGICYVEDRRQLDSIVAQDFIDSLKLYREGSKTRPDGKPFNANQIKGLQLTDGDSYVPTIYELVTLEGRNLLKEKNPNMEAAWVKFNNARGMQAVRLLTNEAEYKRQILKYSQKTVKTKNDYGGLRIYSFSDAEMFHLIDIIQVLTDCAAVGLKVQGYTKVNEYAKAVKDTGEKLNRSLIPLGALGYHIENGKVVLDFDTVEGIDINSEDFFDSKDNPDVGNIVIGINPTQIRAAMVSDFIDYIIPFHTGQSAEVLGENGIAEWVNYKDSQSEVDLATGKKSAHQINIYTEVFQAAENNGKPIQNKRDFVEKFLAVCKENGLKPRFAEFLNTDANGDYVYTEGYHKFLVDFKTFAQTEVGEYLPQMPVKPIFDNAYITGLLESYVEEQQVKDAEVAKQMPKVIERITNEIVKPSITLGNQTVAAQKNTTQKDGVKFSQRKFNKAVDDIVYSDDNAPFDYRNVYMGETPQALLDIGFIQLPMTITSKHIYTIANKDGRFAGDDDHYHNLGANRVMELPELLKKPVATFIEKENPRRVVIVTSEVDSQGRPIMVAVEYSGQTRYKTATNEVQIFANPVTTALGKKDSWFASQIEDAIRDGRMLQADKKRSQESPSGVWSQCPESLWSSDFTTNIEQFKQNVKRFLPKEKQILKAWAAVRESEEKTKKSDRHSDRNNAPTFYSQMGKVVEGMKQEKFGASSVISMLRGRGVKAEEIRWSGIQAFLDGKKSVTKDELLEFIKGSMLNIEAETRTVEAGEHYADDETGEVYLSRQDLANEAARRAEEQGYDPDDIQWEEDHRFGSGVVFTVPSDNGEDVHILTATWLGESKAAKWDDYKLDGGSNYRELVFKMPGATYTNNAMQGHWGYDAQGVLAHARIQDFEADGKKMLFVEEIQSDWHNEGAKEGYVTKIAESVQAEQQRLFDRVQDNTVSSEERQQAYRELREFEREHHMSRTGREVPDAPFKDNYHEFVLKRLLRMAAEEGYDSIGWTTADIQSERWSDKYAEGYRIEYDQDIPKFLKKYGKQWGAEVGKTQLPGLNSKDTYYDVNREETFDNFAVWQDTVRSTIDEQGGDQRNVLFGMDGNDWIAYDKITGAELDRATVNKSSDSVWSMDITPAMKKSVLEEGQAMYSERSVKVDTEGMSSEAKKIVRNLEVRANFSPYSKGEYASYSTERIDRELHRSSATKMDYAKSYIAWVKPEDFLYATTTSQQGRDQIEKEAGELDLDRLRKQTQPIHLTVDFETGKIVGHEGRHRMTALHKAGVGRVAVIFDAWNDDRHNTKPVDMMRIGGQEFDKYHGGLDFYVHDMLPLSRRYADAVRQLFSEVSGSVKFSERGDGTSNRSLLANAFEGITKSSPEYEAIQEYKGHIQVLNMLDKRLSVLNDQIHDIRFTKGKYDAAKLQELESEREEIVGEINRYDKILLNLEASEPLRKVIVRERKKEAQKTREHINEIQQNKKARAEQTEIRHKIRKVVRDLDKLLNRGNKKQNVKEDMKGFASKALELADYLFTDHISNDELIRKGITVRMTPREAALVKETEDILSKLYDHADSLTDEEFTRLDAKRKANEDKLRDLLTAQRNERLSTPVYDLFNDLVTEYASLKNSKQDAVKAAYNEVLEESLRSFMSDDDRVKILKNMRVADMTTEELNWLYRAYTMVLTNVRSANKFFAKGMTESIDAMVTQIVADFGSRKIPDKKLAIVAQKIANKIGWDYEKLFYALDRIGSEAFTKLIMNIANSENIVMQDVMEATAFRNEMVEKYGFNNWAVNKEIDREFLDNTGKKFKLTLGQLMALYAYSRREGAWDHIEYGGFVFGEAALTNPKPADSYKLTKEQCEEITSLLTKEQKGYAEEMQKFLSKTMGAKGNEVSMQLYGIEMFGEENYFPIHVSGDYKAQANESQAQAAEGFQSMSNAGFTHAQNRNAKAPFVLEGFNEIWVDHVNEMSRYHGTVPALEDLRRVMNRSSYSDSTAESTSVKVIMKNHFGEEAVDYFNSLYREANSGAITDKLQRKQKKLLSLFRKNSVAYSLSVVIQQPSAIARAYAMIDKKYFGFKGVGVLTSGVAKAVSSKWNPAYANAYNEMLKYAPGVTMAKEIGGFDTHTGTSIREYLLDTGKSFKQSMKTENLKGKAKAALALVDDNAIANLPAVADKIAWIEIWNACKRETIAKHKDLAPNSEEFMQLVGERFTEVIRATQVYDSMFSKSPLLKSKSLAVQYLVSFMNEPNTTINMAEKAIRDATKGDWKGGVRIAAAVTYSIIFNNVLKAIVYAMRDDDEDETYIEKYIEAVVGGVVADFNPLSYIPYARDVVSKLQGFDIERPDVAIVADAIEAYQAIVKNANKDTEGMTEYQLAELEKKVADANWKLVGSLAAFFGIPVKNIYREIKGVIDHARIASANAGMTTPSSLWDKVVASIPFVESETTKTGKLYDAILSGDKDYIERMKNGYVDKDGNYDKAKYESAVVKALRENDSRIHDAAQAGIDGNSEERNRIFKEIKAELGAVYANLIIDAINAEASKIRNDAEPDKVTGQYEAYDFVAAVSAGDANTAKSVREDIISTYIANGKTQAEAEKAFVSDVKSGIDEAYSYGMINKATAKEMLMEYADMEEEDASDKITYWDFCKKNPNCDLSESKVLDYLEFAEPAHVSLDVYEQFVAKTKGLADIKDEWGDVEVSKRDQVLEVIDSLPITSQQKDALYLAARYAESKIWDVPW